MYYRLLALTSFLAASECLSSKHAENTTSGRLYSKQNCNGVSQELSIDGDHDLDLYIDRKRGEWNSVSFVGTWIFYSKKNYANFLTYVYHPSRGCLTFDTRPISARPVGDGPVNESGITLYAKVNFQGRQVHVKESEPSLWLDSIYSYIISGSSAWTLYGGHYFSGDKTCVKANPIDNTPTAVFDVRESQPAFFGDSIFSAKIECNDK